MPDVNDRTLVREFAASQSETAFAALVERHIHHVHSAAMRQVRDSHLAEEITQAVFIALARKAWKFGPNTILSAWLYRATHFAARDAMRTRRRRQIREQEAYMQSTLNESEENTWVEISPLLDGALNKLGETDRAALVLRFFENKSLREIADTLQVKEDAAQKRIVRALEKLRAIFVKQGVSGTAATIAGAIAANSVQAAPIGMAAMISSTALSGTTKTTAAVIAATKVIAMTTFQKAIVTATLITTVGAGIFETHQAAQLRAQNQTLQQQQASLTAQVQQLNQSLADTTNQLAGLLAENARLKSNPNSNQTELLKLRGEVAQLKNAAMQNENDPVEVAAKNWLTKVNLLKQRLDQIPNAKIPELQYATEIDWLNAALGSPQLTTDENYLWDLHNLLESVEDRFGKMGNKALEKYIKANNGQFPTDLSQLQPYFDSPVDDAILQRYEIVPASSVPQVKELGNDWLVVQKAHVFENYKSEGREVFGANGYGNNWSFW